MLPFIPKSSECGKQAPRSCFICGPDIPRVTSDVNGMPIISVSAPTEGEAIASVINSIAAGNKAIGKLGFVESDKVNEAVTRGFSAANLIEINNSAAGLTESMSVLVNTLSEKTSYITSII